MTLTNWAGNITFEPAAFHRPTGVEAVQVIVAGSTRLRTLGSAHSFSPVACTPGDLISVADLPPRIEVAADRQWVTVAAGLRYGAVASSLHAQGLALHNLGSLPHISIGGAVSTGTHGSGDTLGCLATAVTGLDVVTADGSLLHLDETDARFPGAVVSLGCLGVVTALTLRVQPTYDVEQRVHEGLALATLLTHLDEVFAAGTSVSVFTTWAPRDGDVRGQVWVKRRLDAGFRAVESGWLGTTPAAGPVHPLPGVAAEACTTQLGVPGPWHERLPHFRLDHTPSAGDELQTEYLVPREHAVDALREVAAMAPRIAPVLQVSELRTVAADDLWLSPAQGRDCLAVHFTWVHDTVAVAPVVSEVEARLTPLGARPHWGKVFSTPSDAVAELYPRLAEFRALRAELDPGNHFGNEMTDRYLGVC